MPTATAEPTKTEPVFISKAINFVQTRCPKLVDPMHGGQRQISPGLRYEFQHGVLKVTAELRKRDRDFFAKYGEHYPPDTLEDEFLETDEWLRRQAVKEGDFFEQPVSVPPPDEALSLITDLALDGDLEGLGKLIEEEQAGHNRPVVLDKVRDVLERMVADAEKPKK